MDGGQLAPAILGVLVLAVVALAWGGVTMLRRGNRQKGVLMLVCAVVLAANVAIWTVPLPGSG